MESSCPVYVLVSLAQSLATTTPLLITTAAAADTTSNLHAAEPAVTKLGLQVKSEV